MAERVESGELKSLLAVPFSVIPGKDVEELWPGWFLKRHVTILVAPGGTGKGLMTVDMAARVSTGRAFPGEEDDPGTGEAPVREPANVVMVSPEDDPNESVAWRLRAAGADMSRIFNLTVLPDGSPFIVPDSVGKLHEAMSQIDKLFGPVALVVIDPLFAVVNKPITTNANARRVTTPLERLANETGACIVLTHHTIKDGKVAGVKALTDSVRCVLRIAKEKTDDPEATGRVLSVEKTNVLSDTATLRYYIAGEGKDVCLVWPSEAEQLAEALSGSRGYDIDPNLDPALAPPARTEKPVARTEQDVSRVELWLTEAGHDSRLVAPYASVTEAQRAAQEKCTHRLTWRSGGIEGSYGAAYTEGGQFSHYAVLPAER